MNMWLIGFLWGSSRISGNHLLVQNRNKNLLEKAKTVGNIENLIFETITAQGSTSYRLKINNKNEIVRYMFDKGFEGRNGNEERTGPLNLKSEDEYEFLKGYFSTHYTLDDVKRRKRRVKRLRFYASRNLLEKLNNHLNKHVSTTIKKVADHPTNDICKILYYQSQTEVPAIIEYLRLNDWSDPGES